MSRICQIAQRYESKTYNLDDSENAKFLELVFICMNNQK